MSISAYPENRSNDSLVADSLSGQRRREINPVDSTCTNPRLPPLELKNLRCQIQLDPKVTNEAF